MQQVTPEGQYLINDLSLRYNLSKDAVVHMIIAVNNGGGSMAQFNCPELGGGGQWMRGGMTMVGDMFNYGLKATVDNLCAEISNALVNTQVFPVVPAGTPGSSQWWPAELGVPFSSGGQNNIRYAVFPQRLAVEQNGKVTIYDTLGHQISGVSQQQGGDTSLSFSSQYGSVSVNNLPIVSGGNQSQDSNSRGFQNSNAPPLQTNFAQSYFNEPTSHPAPQSAVKSQNSSSDIVALLEGLGRLRDAGVLSQSEFEAKKSDLLSRI
jgi:hypothetical protein